MPSLHRPRARFLALAGSLAQLPQPPERRYSLVGSAGGTAMTMRVVIAGILGGIAMFIWSTIAHVVTPLGQAGISQIPNEAPVIAAMRLANLEQLLARDRK